MTLPLDGKAIGLTIDWIERGFGLQPAKSPFGAWPDAPETQFPNNREALVRRLEADDEFSLGDYLALISLI
jgi:hypothetical protein